MPSAKYRDANFRGEEDLPIMDTSSMIDLVFLLLIFFMTASNLITLQKDPKVIPPIAPDTMVENNFRGHFVVNIYEDGTLYGIDGDRGPKLDEADITLMASQAVEEYAGTKITPKLHVRGHHAAPVIAIKKATKAAAAGGIINVVFSAWKVK